MNVLRSVSLLSLAGAALGAHAADAYSSLGPAPVSYSAEGGYLIGEGFQQAFRFTATATGTLAGFRLAMNDYRSVGQVGYSVRLYSDVYAGTLGSEIGTYSGMSTGASYQETTSALSTVVATGPALTIQSGVSYWLYAASSGSLCLNYGTSGSQPRYLNGNGVSNAYLYEDRHPAFSVLIGSIPSAVPGPAAALPFIVMALKRRKRA